jgi:hypothetical protein
MTNVPEALLSARAVWVLAHLEWCIDSCPQGMDSRSAWNRLVTRVRME